MVLLDRARFPREKACAEYLSPQASRVLAALGVLEKLEQSGGAQLTGMRVRAPMRRLPACGSVKLRRPGGELLQSG